ncbi:MAG: hypothetical protein RKE49_05265 [Oceanicaulis sp.]
MLFVYYFTFDGFSDGPGSRPRRLGKGQRPQRGTGQGKRLATTRTRRSAGANRVPWALRHASRGVTIAFQINTDVSPHHGPGLAPALETALADLALTMNADTP